MLGEPFKKIFDEALVQAHDRLLQDPRDRLAKVDFVTIYHMILEGTLGIVTSHFLLDLLREREFLPGFVDGYSRIAADEQRHIAYGTWFLREAVVADPAMADVFRDQIRSCCRRWPRRSRLRARAPSTRSASTTGPWRSSGSGRSPPSRDHRRLAVIRLP